MKNKKSFILFSTIILVFSFSIIAVKIYELKSINSINIVNQYKYIQAKNHLSFLEEYINSIKDLELLEKIEIKDTKYKIIALIEIKEAKKYEVSLEVKAIDFNIRVYKVLEVIR